MIIKTDRVTGTVMVTESSLPLRLFGLAFAAGGAIGLIMMPAGLPGKLIAAGFCVAGLGIALTAAQRTVVCDPRARLLKITERRIGTESTERIAFDRIRAIRLEYHAPRPTAVDSHSARTLRLAAVLANGKSVGLSANVSWHRAAKRTAGEAIARLLRVEFEQG